MLIQQSRSSIFMSLAALVLGSIGSGVIATGCGTEQTGSKDDELVGSADDALTADQCDHFAVNGKVQICHHTGSANHPYTIIKTSVEGCMNEHSGHGGDYVAVNDPTCQGGGCLPADAPCDATVPCCDGATCQDGTCHVDPCAAAPCQNGGACTSGGTSYTCTCPPGFTGVNCELIVNPCDGVDCNHGSCVPSGVDWSCVCDDGYTGDDCSTPSDELCGPSGVPALSLSPTPSGAQKTYVADQSLDPAAPSLFTGSCGAAGTPDAIYSFTAPTSDTYHLSLGSFGGFGMWSSMALYALDASTCSELSCQPHFGRADLTLTAGQTIYIVLEGTPPPGNFFSFQLWSGCDCFEVPGPCGIEYTCDEADDVCHYTDHSLDPECL